MLKLQKMTNNTLGKFWQSAKTRLVGEREREREL